MNADHLFSILSYNTISKKTTGEMAESSPIKFDIPRRVLYNYAQKGGGGMYRILVADDEALIRQGIQCLLDYEALGFTICGEAASGEQALEKILRLQPDVVLMDIRMPGLTGLEVIFSAQKQGFRGKVLIISGFSDFSYAQEAIRYGVQGYLTKPIDEEELEKLLRQFKAELDQETSRDSATQHYRKMARASLICDIFQGKLPPDGVSLQQLGLEAPCYQVVLWDNLSPSLPDLPQRLSLSSHPELYDAVELQGIHGLLLKGTAPVRQLEIMLQRNRQTQAELDGLFLACGDVVTGLNRVCESFRQAIQLHRRRFFCQPGQHILDSSALASIPATVTPLGEDAMQRYTSRILDCLHTFNRRELVQTLQQLEETLFASGNPPEALKLFLTDLYLQIKEKMCRLYPDCAIPFYSNTVIIHSLEHTLFLHESILFLASRFEMILNAIGVSNRDSVLDDVLHYIHHNYADNITLESIAPLFGYNRSYLGKIFTRKTGMSLGAYVDQVRVERAKELLLSTDTKVYAIAQRVGYKNVDYFHIKFKKIVNMSPAEFRKEHLGK